MSAASNSSDSSSSSSSRSDSDSESSSRTSMSDSDSESSRSTSSDDDNEDVFDAEEVRRNAVVESSNHNSTGAIMLRRRLSTFFVPCARLATADWVRRLPNRGWARCVEHELRPDSDLEDVVKALEFDTTPPGVSPTFDGAGTGARLLGDNINILDGLMSPAPNEMQVLWLSSCVFIASGCGSDDLDTKSHHRLTAILILSMKFFHRGAEVPRQYVVYCPTRHPGHQNVAEKKISVAATDAALALIAGGTTTSWHTIVIGTRRALRPCSVSIGAIQTVVASDPPHGAQARNVDLQYYGLADGQWKQIFEAFHPTTSLVVPGFMTDPDHNFLPCLLEAIRRGYGPRGLLVQCNDQFATTQLEDLGSSLAEGACVVKDIFIWAADNRSRNALRALLTALATTTASSLQKLTVVFHSSASTAEWESIWNVAAVQPRLKIVRVSCRQSLTSTTRAFDPLPAILAAARSNRRLTTITIPHTDGLYHRNSKYVKRVQPLLRSNSMYTLTHDVKECTDASWRFRLFSAALGRLCHPNPGKAAGKLSSLSFLAQLLRGNPDLLEQCSRVSDVLRRQWDDHMKSATFHLERAAELERRMARAGTEIPNKKRRHPHSAT